MVLWCFMSCRYPVLQNFGDILWLILPSWRAIWALCFSMQHITQKRSCWSTHSAHSACVVEIPLQCNHKAWQLNSAELHWIQLGSGRFPSRPSLPPTALCPQTGPWRSMRGTSGTSGTSHSSRPCAPFSPCACYRDPLHLELLTGK